MHQEILIAIIIAVPVILFPAVYLWYINMGFKTARERRVARKAQ